MKARTYLLIGLAAGALTACGDDDSCDPVAQTGCDDGFVCEEIDGSDEPGCFAPVVIRGTVFDLADGTPVEGARVMALDVNRSPRSSVAITDMNGQYELTVPSLRDANGVPDAVEVTLRAEAQGYQNFPAGLRQALPVDTGTAADEGDAFVVQSALTDVGLIALPDDSATGHISGTVETPADGNGVLVVAEGPVALSTFADADGDYAIFNVPDGDYEVRGYSRGVNYDPASVTVAGDNAVADLALSDAPTSTLIGKIEMADPGMGTATSVILVVASTFDEVLLRGATPPGLRAPAPGIAPDVTGQFTIDGIPDGDYKILAAFENDYLVRDPDTCIAGTDILQQSFASGDEVDLSGDGFKVTGSIQVIGPGADGAEAITGTPTLSWVDDSSEAFYRLSVFDSFGQEVWYHEEPSHSGDDPAVPYDGPALEAGMYYQFRVTSVRTTGGGTNECEISTTEDLKGVFFVESSGG